MNSARFARSSLRVLLPLFTLARLVITTSFRMVYPLLPAFRDGLGVSLGAISQAVAARALASAISPFLAATADSRGRKAGMLFGLALFAAGCATVVFWPSFAGFVLGLVLAGLGKYVFDPAMQAYLGDRVPYGRRGLTLTVTELAWSGSFVLGVPVMGWLIARGGWLAPFPILALMGLALIVLFLAILPRDQAPDPERPSLRANFASVLASRMALFALGFTLFSAAANEVINLVFGVWMEDSFGVQLATLGAAAAVIGVAEIGGEGLVAMLADRFGKRRAILAGLLLNALAALLLPVLGRSLFGAVLGLFLLYITFEFLFVSSIPLMTEILPRARATLMALNITSASLGRALGSLLGPELYARGFALNIAALLLFNMFAFLCLYQVRIRAEDGSAE